MNKNKRNQTFNTCYDSKSEKMSPESDKRRK